MNNLVAALPAGAKDFGQCTERLAASVAFADFGIPLVACRAPPCHWGNWNSRANVRLRIILRAAKRSCSDMDVCRSPVQPLFPPWGLNGPTGEACSLLMAVHGVDICSGHSGPIDRRGSICNPAAGTFRMEASATCLAVGSLPIKCC